MELWDIYDIDRVRTGRVAQRGKPASEGGLGEGEYHLVVHICVFNGRGQLLLQQRQKDKEGYPNLWDVSAAGSALAGENSAAAASRELREELGLVHDFTKERPFLTTHFERGFDDWYFIRIEANINDLCASLQKTVVDILLGKLVRAAREFRIRDIAIAGGVSANSGLRKGVTAEGERRGWRTFLPPLKFTTDNAAMIAVTGYFRYRQGEFSSLSVAPEARIENMLSGE